MAKESGEKWIALSVLAVVALTAVIGLVLFFSKVRTTGAAVTEVSFVSKGSYPEQLRGLYQQGVLEVGDPISEKCLRLYGDAVGGERLVRKCVKTGAELEKRQEKLGEEEYGARKPISTVRNLIQR